jgi:hypothetical protein
MTPRLFNLTGCSRALKGALLLHGRACPRSLRPSATSYRLLGQSRYVIENGVLSCDGTPRHQSQSLTRLRSGWKLYDCR